MGAVDIVRFTPVHLDHAEGTPAHIGDHISIRARRDWRYKPLPADQEGNMALELAHTLVSVTLPREYPIRGAEPIGKPIPTEDGRVRRRYRLRLTPNRPELSTLELVDGTLIVFTEGARDYTRLRLQYPAAAAA